MPSQISLTMHLLRTGTTLSGCIRDLTKVQEHPITASGVVGSVFVKVNPTKAPAWLAFVDPLIGQTLPSFSNSSSSGVVVLDVGARRVAFTFGQGRHLLRRETLELDFGLKVALNALDPNKLRSLDVRTYEEVALLSRKQISRSARLDPFAVDKFRDVLTAVVGAPTDETMGKRLVGRDSIVLTQKLDATELPVIAQKLLALYNLDDYKTDFGWIDRVRRVRDSALILKLDGLLEKELTKTTSSPLLYFAPPDILDWEDVDHFRFSNQRQKDDTTFEDLDLDEWKALLSSSKKSMLDRLKNEQAMVVRKGSAECVPLASLYDCTVFEVTHRSQRYALLAGEWFVLDKDFVKEINDRVNDVPVCTLGFPAAVKDEAEKDYLSRASATLPQFAVLDAKPVTFGGGHSSIEVCDLLDDQGVFVHAKRRSRSSTLSHLWAQGSVSAKAVKGSAEFRSKVEAKVGGSLANLFKSAPSDGQFEVVYLVIGASASHPASDLPFFSKVALSQILDDVALAGFRVGIAGTE